MRCFIAAWPTDETRLALDRLIAGLKGRVPEGRAMQARNLHLTLAFIGDLAPDRARDLANNCNDLPSDPCDWTIDTLGSFARARVAWAGGAVNDQLAACAARARARLDELGIPFDRKAFVPHVTLFRDVRRFDCAGPLAEPIQWHSDHVALYAADRDARGPIYRRVKPPNGARSSER
jgi:RNA 2',3'-cyclic 3'-phosphodiesterase